MAEKKFAKMNLPDIGDHEFDFDETTGKITNQFAFGNLLFFKMLSIGRMALQKHVYVDEYCNLIDDMEMTLHPYKDEDFKKDYAELEKRYKGALVNAKRNINDKTLLEWKLNFKDQTWKLLTELMMRRGLYPETTI